MPQTTLRRTAPVVDSILDLVGHTPMLRLRQFSPDAAIFAKLEYLNPGGSVKDRIGVGMIQAAEKAGLIKPGLSTIIEPTAGNTGVGLAIAAKAMGYRCILCVPTKYSREKMLLMKALGAELVLIPKELGMKGAIAKCAELAASLPHAYVPQQFENPSNPDTHYRTTAEERFTVQTVRWNKGQNVPYHEFFADALAVINLNQVSPSRFARTA